MTQERDLGDARILELLGSALVEADPVPEDVTAFAVAAFSWRDIEAELAEISFDSLDEAELSGVRGPNDVRMLSFETPDLGLDFEYRTGGRLVGQIDPPQAATIELHQGGEVATVEADDLGRFAFDEVAPGPVSIVCRTHGDHSIVIKTAWTIL